MADVAIKVAKRRREPVTFTLEGKDREYSFKPPKQASMVLPMMDAEDDLTAAKEAFAWLDRGLSEDDRAHIKARLDDEEDDLDFPSIEDTVTSLVEYLSARPTT